MRRLDLSIHGIGVRVSSDEGEALEPLGRDFRHFEEAGQGISPDIVLTLRREPPPPSRLPRLFLPWRSARISRIGTGDGSLRRIDYPGGARLDYDLGRERGTLWTADPDLSHELAYLTVLSRVGRRLDLEGRHRVHALGFTYRAGAGLVLLASGGGKSRLALELLGRPGFGILSDDAPLLDRDGRVAPFPLRLGLRGDDWRGIPERHLSWFRRRRFGPKRLVDLEYFSDRVAAPAPLAWLLVGRPAWEGGAPGIGPCSRPRAAAALAANLVLGLGTAQVLELMLPSSPFGAGSARLAEIAWRRARSAAAAVGRARRAVFSLGGDPARAAGVLRDYLDRNPP